MMLRELLLLFSASLLSASCTSTQYVIPEPLAAQVDPTLSFTDITQAPTSHLGKVILLGGEVLHAKRVPEGTVLEILQLPLSQGKPVGERSASQGRFLAVQQSFLDPATLTDATRVTLVGQVAGVKTQQLDETAHTYPFLQIKDLKVWPPETDPYGPRTGPRFGVSIGGGTGVGVGGGAGVGFGF
jgi:outer membrane lipoprotein